MNPLAVDLTMLLRTLESEVRIAPGRVLTARVVDNGDPTRAKLSIAGKLLEAQLPSHLKAGEEVRLTVSEVSAEKVVLSLSTPLSAEAPRQASDHAKVSDEDASEQEADEDREHTRPAVSLRYQAPTLGAVDVRLQMGAGVLHALVGVRAGQPHKLAREQTAELRERLADATGLPVDLIIQARHDPIELYA